MVPLDRFLNRLDGVRRAGDGWKARCPAHEDRRASLSLVVSWDGKILVHCHAGCAVDAVMDAIGLPMSALFAAATDARPSVSSKDRSPSVETTYEIRDRSGQLQAYHVRRDGPGNVKTLAWRLPSGSWGLKGRSTASMPLYGIERVSTWPVDEPVFIVEGEKVCDALVAAGRHAIATVTGSSACPEAAVLSDLAGRIVIASPDHDDAGERHMKRVVGLLAGIAREVRWVDPRTTPAKGDIADLIAPGRSANDLHLLVTDGRRLGVEASVWADIDERTGNVHVTEATWEQRDKTDETSRPGGSVGFVPHEAGGWPEIERLLPDAPLPPFPLEALPSWMAEMVKAVAANTETDPSMGAVTALGLASVPLSNRYRVQTPTWTEKGVQLFTVAVADSGEFKSAVFSLLDAALREHERECQLDERPARRDRDLAHKDIEARVAIARDELKKAMKSDNAARAKAGLPQEGIDAPTTTHESDPDVAATEAQLRAARVRLRAVEVELAEDQETEVAPYALLADDATQEALQRQMAAQDGRTGIVSAESELFTMAAGRYSDKSPNLQVYLAGYTGEPLRAERITRDAPPVEHPGLAIVIATQPVMLEEACRNAHFVRRGLLARFLFAVPASRAGTRHLAARPAIHGPVERDYREVFRRLCRLGDEQRAATPTTLLLIGDAAKRLAAWHDGQLEPRRHHESGDLGSTDAIVAWAARLHGLVVRIAGVLHIAEHLGQAGSVSIEVSTMERAIRIGEWAIEHAYAAFGIDRLDRRGLDAVRVLRWYRNRDQPEATFTIRDARRALRGVDADRVRAAVHLLEEHAYVRVVRAPSGPSGGRPSDRVEVNPQGLVDA